MKRIPFVAFAAVLLTVGLLPAPQVPVSPGQPQPVPQAKAVTPPKAHFGFNIGDDYCLANYQQLTSYWKKLEAESDRLKLVTIGTTEEGRPQLMGVVTSPANHRELGRYRDIARRLTLAEGVGAAEAAQLAAAGKAVVWIDGGLHASESLCAQALIETLYQFVSSNDPETLRILDGVIILFVHANPDGMDLVADWYMRAKDPQKRSLLGLPRLYQKYIGHDNNRDFYANTQAETKNMNRVLYREWFPQIVYNHHQTGPAGTVLFVPPFRDPFNYQIDPLVISGIDAVGAAMMQRFLAEDKPGATCRSGAPYSTWFNGGLRTTTYFHNMIGLLSETVGSPTPMQIPFVPGKQLPRADYLAPVPPQTWHFRQSVDYSVTANKAVLDYASRHREQLLHSMWLMGKKAIDRGGRDSWTITPRVVQAAQDDGAKFMKGSGGAKEFERFFHQPEKRDPRGYILPFDQSDFLTATKFVNVLFGTGVKIHVATADFTVAGKKYRKGSYVVKCAQAFRAHALDMFEPQDHPNDFAYPGASPTPPYDSAGYTLAYQMGVQFDRILDGFDGPFAEVKSVLAPPPAMVLDADGAVGFFLAARTNDAFRAVNRLLKAGEEVGRLQEPFNADGVPHPAGMFFVTRRPTTLALLEKIAGELGTRFVGTRVMPGKEAAALKPVRLGLWDRQGGSMPSGWTRWLLEQFEFPYQVVFVDELDKGGLRDKFDVLVFVDDAATARDGPGAATVAQLAKFLDAGGTVLAIGGATYLGKELGLGVANHLVVKYADGTAKAPGRDAYYVPASVLQVRVDPKQPLAWGMGETADVMFANSPTFRLPGEGKDLVRVAWFDGKAPLRSGWAMGQEYLDGGVAVVDARVGKGRLVLYGPQILFRGQPHGTFKLFFNGIVRAGS
jgi:hypothetical protein